MAYLTEYEYYNDEANHGSYQYVSLDDIINNFSLMYTGNHSLVVNEPRHKILWHAKRAIQELHYDALKEVKILELDVCDDLKFTLPHDYVSWVRISLYKDGILRPLSENFQTNHSDAYLQDEDCKILFDEEGEVHSILKPENSFIDIERMDGTKKSVYMGGRWNGLEGYQIDGSWYFELTVGKRFGLQTSTASMNPTFSIDKQSGVINFSSDMAGELCILEYVTDGMEQGSNSDIKVNKLFEDYIYKKIEFEILESKRGVPDYEKRRLRKKVMALKRNAKLRMAKISPMNLLLPMRGKDKWLK